MKGNDNLMRTWSASIALAVAMTSSPALASPDAQPRYAPVSVQTNFEGEEPERTRRIEPALEKRASEVLQLRHGITVEDEASAAVVMSVRALEESPKAADGNAVTDYGVQIEVIVDGEAVGDEIVPCPEKGEAELVDCAVDGLASILHHIPTLPAEDSERDPGSDDRPPDNETRGDDVPDEDRVSPIGVLGGVGIVLAAGGLGSTIAGSLDLARGKVTDDPSSSGEERSRDYRRRGAVLLGVGLSAIVVGTVLVVTDTRKRAKRRKTSAAITVSQEFSGITVTGRF